MSDDRPKRSMRDARRGDRPVAPAEEAVRSETATPTTPPSPLATELSSAPERPERPPAPEPAPALPQPPPLETTPAQAAGNPAGPEPMPPPPGASEAEPAFRSAPELRPADPWVVFAEAQAAFARGFEEIAGEVTGFTRSGLAATADAAVALLGSRTFAEVIEINAEFARRGVDIMIDGSARLSEIGVNAVSQAARPILSQFGAAWSETGLR